MLFQADYSHIDDFNGSIKEGKLTYIEYINYNQAVFILGHYY